MFREAVYNLAIMPTTDQLRDFAERYTAAWCSHSAANAASFYSLNGSITINGGTPSIGRPAIAKAFQAFMTDFPDLKILMNSLESRGDRIIYQWTLVGTNTGPGGTGKSIHISGFEDWRIGSDGLIAASLGHFDSVEYCRQLQCGA